MALSKAIAGVIIFGAPMLRNTKLHFFLMIGLWLLSIHTVMAQPWFNKARDRWQNRSKAEQTLGLEGGFESRSSFIRFQPVSLYAIKGGISIRERAYFYLGYHWLATPVFNLVKTPLGNGQDSLIKGQLHLSYFSQSFELVFYRSEEWRLAVPLLIGLGSKNYTDLNKGVGGMGSLSKGRFIPFEASIAVTYRTFRWLGVGGSLGYRTSLLQPIGPQGEDYRGITYSMGFSVYLRPLYKVLQETLKKP